MSHIWGNTIYSLLEQTGPFATADTPPGFKVFSPESRKRSKCLREKELVTDKTNGITRILVIGDSFAFGQGVPVTDRFSNIIHIINLTF